MQSIKDILARYAGATAAVTSSGKDGGKAENTAAGSGPLPVNCPVCHDRGIVLDGEVGRPCSCMKQKEIFNKFKHARISRAMMQQTFSTFRLDYYSRLLVDPDRNRSYFEFAQKALQGAKQFVQEYVRNGSAPGLMFTGPVGSGKTFLASAIANALTERDRQVLFLVVPDLLDDLRATYSRKDSDHTEQDLLDTARSVPVLILDDLGAHNYTEWTRNRIYSIINYRLNYGLPVVITTNLNMEELDEYLGERTTSRLSQMCRGFKLFVEQDIRMLKYQEREKAR